MSTPDFPNRAAPVTPLPLAPCFEFIAYPGSAVGGGIRGAWPAKPGAALRDATGRPRLLHFAPERWLAPAPEAALWHELTRLEREGRGVLVDVEGKWQEMRLAEPQGRHILSSGIDVEGVLAGRDCAAVVLFDCPGILARHEDTFALWIAASFAQSWIAVSSSLPSLRPSS
jgi:hypothetical protein